MKNIIKLMTFILFTGHLAGSIYRFLQGDLIVGFALFGASLALGTICWQRIFAIRNINGRKVLAVIRFTGLIIATIFLMVYIFAVLL